jgi:large subunit ribosomal protein L10
MLTKEQKHEQSLSLRENLSGVNTLFLLENHGLNVNDVNVLRAEIRKTEATYKVVKNTVVRLAVEGTEMEAITPFLTGPKVLAYTGGDGVALAKVLKDFIKNHPELRFEQAFLEGQILEAKEAEKIADLPSRDELIAKLVNLLHSPIRRLAVALNAPLQQFANVIGQIADKGDEAADPQEVEAAQDTEEAEPQEVEAAQDTEEAEPQEVEAVQDTEEASKAEEPQEPGEAEAPEASQETQDADGSAEAETEPEAPPESEET